MHRWAREAGHFGTRVERVSLDWPAVVARQHAIVERFQPTTDSFEYSRATQLWLRSPPDPLPMSARCTTLKLRFRHTSRKFRVMI